MDPTIKVKLELLLILSCDMSIGPGKVRALPLGVADGTSCPLLIALLAAEAAKEGTVSLTPFVRSCQLI